MASPIPDPNALRRDRKDDATWTTLPAKVDVKLPAWPLVGQTEREVELWTELWKRPQALLWKQNFQETEVALYARKFALVEVDGGAAHHTVLIRQMESLLLTIPAMYKARVKIAADEVKSRSSKKAVTKAAGTPATAMRDRLKVVSNGGA